MRISEWSSDVCSSDLASLGRSAPAPADSCGAAAPSRARRCFDGDRDAVLLGAGARPARAGDRAHLYRAAGRARAGGVAASLTDTARGDRCLAPRPPRRRADPDQPVATGARARYVLRPVLATRLGNTYARSSVRERVFNNVSLPVVALSLTK